MGTAPERPIVSNEMIDASRYSSLGELLGDALVTFKSHVALVEVDRKKSRAELTYRDVARAVQPLARRLEQLGIGAGDRVAIVMSNQSKWLIAAMAALHRGAVLVPIDYKLTAPEQAALLEHCGAKLVFVEHPLFRRFDRVPGEHVIVTEAPAGEALPGAGRWEDTDPEAPAPPPVPRTRDDVATIVYSSGTGGRPKGCMLTHDCYLEQYRSLTAIFPLATGHRYFSILPTNHAIDFMCGFIGPLCGGATVVHQRTLRPEFIRHTMKTERITHMALVPLVLEAFERTIRERLDEQAPLRRSLFDGLSALNAALTRRVPNPGLSRRLLGPVHDAFGGHLELLFCGGAFVDRDRAQFFYDLGLPVVIGYGLTEACTVVTVNDLRPFRADSVGRAVDGAEIEIRGEDPVTGIGEVWVRSRTVMKGYLDDPEQTAEVLQDGWLRTGDLGHLDAAHHLHLVGRSKNMIVTAGGKNVYPEDIEGAFEGLPCEELVVFSRSFLWPGGPLTDESLVAVVRGGDDGFRDELRARNHRLPDFKRIDGWVPWDEPFPRTASMKVKRGELAERLRSSRDRLSPL